MALKHLPSSLSDLHGSGEVFRIGRCFAAPPARSLFHMSNFRPVDRDTGFLMPPSVDEWLPERHLARVVTQVIEGLDLRPMTGDYRGSAEASYHPGILLGLLIYGYATGVFSSRKLERATGRRRNWLAWYATPLRSCIARRCIVRATR